MFRRALDDAAEAYVLRVAEDKMLLFAQRSIDFCMANFYSLDVVSHSAIFVLQ